MSNPTTPFSWQMPTATDLVTDLPADFEVFGQAVATSMADLLGGTTGQVLSKTTNADMDFTWVTTDDANAIQNSIVDAKGDLIAATANDTPARLAVGTNGHVLTADSTQATGMKWAAAAAGGGKVLQVVSFSTTTNFTNNTTTYGDTGVTATITPSAASSKVMVIVSQSYFFNASAVDSYCKVKLLRGATDIVTNAYFGYTIAGGASSSGAMAVGSITYLDSPSTTSATTYKTQAAAGSAGTNLSCQWSGNMTSTITLMEIGA
jgi:hypothetical protein